MMMMKIEDEEAYNVFYAFFISNDLKMDRDNYLKIDITFHIPLILHHSKNASATSLSRFLN